MVVCGPRAARQQWMQELVAAAGRPVEVFSEVEPDPSDATVAAAGRRAAEAGARILVAVGGGSSIDASKAAAVEAVAPGWIFAQDRPGQATQITADPLPVVAVPTTAGTGSEVTPFSVITFSESRRKLVLNHPRLFPRAAILDPALLVTAPRHVRVAAGMDALTHAVESFTSTQATDRSRARAWAAMAQLYAHLEAACNEPPSRAGLWRLQWAAMIAGLAFAHSRLGIVHAMALPLSALFGVPHGVANAILLPYGMRFNAPAAVRYYSEVARAFGIEAAPEEAAAKAAEAVRSLAVRLGAPLSMSEVGVPEAAIERMAADAICSAHIRVNPRPIELADLVAVYRQALHGQW
ncbi:MAG: iron-containing alcohol dehydrogenase [Armatimonadetes bacterium]|nr:iron-containing alcohol dehydrogenase [Armatimonadota bacterium]